MSFNCCQTCGGFYQYGVWHHNGKQCGVEVQPGELVGLFVPHLCQRCYTAALAKDRARGNVCGLCGKPVSGNPNKVPSLERKVMLCRSCAESVNEVRERLGQEKIHIAHDAYEPVDEREVP